MSQRADSMMSLLSETDASLRTINVCRANTRLSRFLCYSRTKQSFRDNEIITSKYNFLTFLPLNLLIQFSKFANLYFLILTVLECFPAVSDSGGVPVLLMPLGFVVGISMIKDIYEDYIRHRSDNEENNRSV